MTRSIAQKLGIRPGTRVFGIDPGGEVLGLLDPLPGGVVIAGSADDADAAVLACRCAAELESLLAAHAEALRRIRAPWIAYRKGGRSDINRDSIWRRVEAERLTLNSNVALSEEWSAVRLKDAR